MQETPTRPTQAPPRAETVCPTCAAPAERGQLVCLNCGRRLALDYRRPGGWKAALVIVGVVVLTAAVAFALVLNVVSDDAENEVGGAGAARDTGAARDAAADRAAARRAKERREAAAASRAQGERKEPQPRQARRGGRLERRGGLFVWPSARDAYTVVLLSTDNPGSARSFARSAVKGGVRAGVLRSNDYKSLTKGFWVVFAGLYATRPKAEQATVRLSSRFPGVFPQFVSRTKGSKSAP